MSNVGAVIDAAVNRGANVVDYIDFEVSETNQYYMIALNLAVENAIMKAQSVTQNLGIMLNPIPQKISENIASPIPYRNFAARESTISTPIEAGNKLIEASVTVEFQFG